MVLPNKHTQTYHTEYNSPLGTMLLAATDKGLCGAWFWGQLHAPSRIDMRNWKVMEAASPAIQKTLNIAMDQLNAYFARRQKSFDRSLPLDLSAGTEFQQAVWRSLLQVNYGATTSYKDIALLLNNVSAVRAVGAAIGRNPVSVIVPCHRVIGSNGALTGYAGGLNRKVALLDLEHGRNSLGVISFGLAGQAA